MPDKTDIWMPLYIGDYLSDTSHLTTEQHGAYLLLLMHYWRTGPLPDDDAQLAQVCRLNGHAWSIAKPMLRKFFALANDGLLHQKRLDAELVKWNAKKLKAKKKAAKAANSRWKTGCLKDAPSTASSNQQAMRASCPLPLPIKNKNNGTMLQASENQLSPEHVALAVKETCNLAGQKLTDTLMEICRPRLSAGEDPTQLRDRLVTAWWTYQKAIPKLKWTYGSPTTFYASGSWHDAKLWPWQDGQAPAVNGSRKYWEPEDWQKGPTAKA